MNADAERTLTNPNDRSPAQNDMLMTNDVQFDIYTPTTLRAVF